MTQKSKIVVESVKARHLRPSNRDRVIRPKKGGGYRRRARGRREEG